MLPRLCQLVVLVVYASTVLAQQGVWQQCGGTGWTGATTCVSGATCTRLNDWYYQCTPGPSTSTSTSTTSTTTSTTTTTTTTSTSTSSTTTTATSSTSATSGPTQTPPANVHPEWTAAYLKAKAAVARLSLQDKVNLCTGVGWENGACVGNTPAVSSINFPGLCLNDAPLGIRFADLVSAFPAGINTAATFNRTLIYERGKALGEEFRGKGVNVALGPAMNMARAPAAGRNWEGFGGDPFLAGEASYETIRGIQSQGVQACAKHYINNEQEHSRETSSSNVDDRTQHEIYAYPFLRSVQANVASVMCSYNQINGTYACENDKALNGILKGEFGFQGYVMSDWWATHSTESVNAGLDMTMPGDTTINSGQTYFGPALVSAIQSGRVSQSRIDNIATRILAGWYLLKQDSGFPATNFNAWNAGAGQHLNVQGDHKELIRTIGVASTVLLKNVNNALPLTAPRTIAVVGNGAGTSSRGANGYTDRGGTDGILAMGWGSGTCDFPYLISPLDAITTRSRNDGSTVTSSLSDNDLNAARNAAAGKDVALVFIVSNSGEAYITVEGHMGDRNDLKAWHNGDALVQAVASVNKNTIVVANTVGPIIVEPWIDHPNVTALVWSGLPGQEAGNSLVDVLYGAYNPSGRLPYTVGKAITDYSAQVIYQQTNGLQIPYSEGLFVDYHHFDSKDIAPRYEFGFGLSYTTFEYASLSVTGSAAGGTRQPNGPGQSLDPWLHDKVVSVTFTLRNSGTRFGNEIPQLYITPPASTNSPPKKLRGFDSVALAPGQSKSVTFELSRFDLSIWNTATQRYEVPAGVTNIGVGASSRNIRLTGSVTN